MQKESNKNKIAFIAEEYMEEQFASGGVKLNTFFLKELKKRGYQTDIYCKNKKCLNGTFKNIYSIEEFTEEKRSNYDLVISEKAVIPSDITYLHDHSNVYRLKCMKKNGFLYKIFNRKHYLKRAEQDKRRKNNLSNTKKIVVSSDILKKDIMQNYNVPEEKIHIIHPPILNFEEMKDGKIKQEQCTFGMSALGFETKGGFVLLKALQKFKIKNKNFKVIIIHRKSNLYIKLLITLYGLDKYIKFIGFTEDMKNFYDSLSFILAPSLVETFGMVIVEAMARKVPVIVSSRCGACELIENGKNGFIFNMDDKKASDNLAQAIINAVNLSENEYKQISENAYETVKDDTLENFTESMIKLFDN